MLFTSPIFLFAFLPVILIAYYILPAKARNGLLLAGSLLFYAWGETVYLAVLLASIGFNFGAGILLGRCKNSTQKKWIAGAATAGNVGLLAAFKYLNFLIENLNVVLSAVEVSPLAPVTLHFPIGVSFFTFKAMSYLLDVYRGRISVQKNLFDVARYIAFFPHLTAGPIARFDEIGGSLRNPTVSAALSVSGIKRFIYGLAKKVIIADPLGAVADQIFALAPESLTFGVGWLGIICFTLQIYFDFSGYSDMAIGIGRMFGFTIRENFEYPYITASVREFWRRWHISLSTWFRDYLYIPLGGNRCAPWRVYVNLFSVFLLCGLWHGAHWNFVIWGMVHGLFIVGERIGLERILSRIWKPIRHGYALFVIVVAWVFFRAETFSYALAYVQALFGFGIGDNQINYSAYYLTGQTTGTLVLGFVFSTPIYRVVRRKINPLLERNPLVYFPLKTAVLSVLFFLSIMHVAANTYKPFIYFRF